MDRSSLTEWQTDWCDRQTDRPTDWLIDWLFYWLIDINWRLLFCSGHVLRVWHTDPHQLQFLVWAMDLSSQGQYHKNWTNETLDISCNCASKQKLPNYRTGRKYSKLNHFSVFLFFSVSWTDSILTQLSLHDLFWSFLSVFFSQAALSTGHEIKPRQQLYLCFCFI